MPPETDTIEQAATGADGTQAGITDAGADAHREPDPSQEKAGESQSSGTAEGTKPELAAVYEGMSPEEFDALIKGAPEELRDRSTVLKEERRRGEQSGTTQVRQELESLERRRSFYDDAIAQRDVADAQLGEWLHPDNGVVATHRARLSRALADGDTEEASKHQRALDNILGSDDLPANIEAYAQGERAVAARDAQAGIRMALAKYEPILGDLTEQEEAAVKEAIKRDVASGKSTAQGIFIDLWAARLLAKGKELGRAEAEKDLQATEKLGARVEAIQRARNGAPRAGMDGTGGNAAEQLKAEIRALDVMDPDYEKKSADLHARARAMGATT